MGLELRHFSKSSSYAWVKAKNFMKKFSQKYVIFRVETVCVNCCSSDWPFEAIDNRNSVWFENDYHRLNDRMPSLTFSSLDGLRKVLLFLMNDNFLRRELMKLLRITLNLFFGFGFQFFRLVDIISLSKI